MVPTIKRKLETTIQKIGNSCNIDTWKNLNHVLVIASVTGCFGYGFFTLLSQLDYFPPTFVLFVVCLESGMLGAMIQNQHAEGGE